MRLAYREPTSVQPEQGGGPFQLQVNGDLAGKIAPLRHDDQFGGVSQDAGRIPQTERGHWRWFRRGVPDDGRGQEDRDRYEMEWLSFHRFFKE